MLRRMRRSPETIFLHVFILVITIGLISTIKSTYHDSAYYSQNIISRRGLDIEKDRECRLVHSQPNQCEFVKQNCPDEEAGLFSYLQLYYCTLPNAKPLGFIIQALWISILFSTIGIAASDFLCLNLSTIAAVLGMSENLAGVTFLAFGNGSPDVFSTFAAFSSHSGSLAVGELMGAAGFITAVVAGSMAITKPFRVAKKAFVRDVVLFTIAAGFSLNFLKDGSLRMWECIVMIAFYVVYVIFVLIWHWWFDRRRKKRLAETTARLHQHIPDQQELDVPHFDDDEESRPAAESTPLVRTASGGSVPTTAYTPGTPAWVAENVDEDDDEARGQYLAALSSNMRVARPTRSRRNTYTPIRPSLIGALEFRAVLSALEKKSTNTQPIHMRRYSDDSRHALERTSESQAAISYPELLSETAKQPDSEPTPPSLSGRARAVSTNDARTLGMSRDFLDIHSGTPETAIYAPNPASRPQTPTSESSRAQRAKDPSSPVAQHAQNLLLSPHSATSPKPTPGTPSSTTATKNGLLAPPEPDFYQPDHDDEPRTGTQTAGTSSVNPSSFVPKLRIPETGHVVSQHTPYVDSPLAMSSNHSRPPSFRLPPPSMSPESSHVFPLPQDSPPLKQQVRWWPYKILPEPEVLLSTLFPGLCEWSSKGWAERILALFTAPSIFFLTITVPVVDPRNDSDSDDGPPVLTPMINTPDRSQSPTLIRLPPSPAIQSRAHSRGTVPQITTTDEADLPIVTPKGWNRWLAILQAFTAPFFTVVILWANIEDKSDTKLLVRMLLGSLVFSLLGLAALLAVTSPNYEPKHKPVLCFMGFFVAIAWISTVAGEVVGVLKSFGVILNISDAILGLTIFAVGNSLGDLVADITVARLGYPMMALSACFGGPMLNILLGIGIGGLYQTLNQARHNLKKHPDRPIDYKPYELEINTTLLVSGATLLITLVFLLIVVPLNSWRMDRKIGAGLIAIWATSTILNVVLEITGVGESER